MRSYSGDFRSPECIALLKEADIVVSNPPFSLFREYVAQLVEYEKKFLIVGSQNAITYKEIFKLIKENKLWLGYGFSAGNAYFEVPDDYSNTQIFIINGKRLAKFRSCCWFTNLDTKKRHEDLILYKKYTPEEYQKYDNYDAINVDKIAEIPQDYKGVMGVPITFVDKYNPDQFEIIGLIAGNIRGMAGIVSTNGKDGPYINGKLKYGRVLIRNLKPIINKRS
ncbi:putative site-specific DNA-methyltransferase (adenine-specific) [Pillotina sp. SPG140]